MNPLEVGRIRQSRNFTFPDFNGLKLEALIGDTDTTTREPIIIFIKAEGHSWHQYFLDAGLGFWENWEKENIEEEIEPEDWLNYTNHFQIKNKVISKIFCQEDFNNSRITIEFEDGIQIILKCVSPKIFDSNCEIILRNPKN